MLGPTSAGYVRPPRRLLGLLVTLVVTIVVPLIGLTLAAWGVVWFGWRRDWRTAGLFLLIIVLVAIWFAAQGSITAGPGPTAA